MTGRRIVVVRHGRTAYNHEDRWQGQLDIPLDDVGRHQAALMGPEVGSLDPVAIVSSDLARARDTAAAIASTTGLSLSFDPRLREINAGQWEGLTGSEVRARFPGETVGVGARQPGTGSGRGQGVHAGLGGGHALRRLYDEVLADLVRHSGSSDRARHRGCRRAG